MYIHRLGGGIRSRTNCFFLLSIFPSAEEKKAKRYERNIENSKPQGFEVHRFCMKGDRLPFKEIKAIFMLRLQVLVTCNLLSIVVVYYYHSGLGMFCSTAANLCI